LFPDHLLTSRLLIVDDNPANTRVLERMLRQAGFTNIASTTDSREVIALYATDHPDLILLDLHMPHLDGFAVLEQLKATLLPDDYLPVLVLTADVSSEAKHRALALGGRDFVTKPFDAAEVMLRVRNLLETRWLYQQQAYYNLRLEAEVRARTQEAVEAKYDTLERLARAAEYRDDMTGEHTRRVGELAASLAEAHGLSDLEVSQIRCAAPLHDIGKIGISDAILLKPGKLTADEFTRMQRHSEIGARILSGSQNALLQLAESIALSHHERWDGQGYPQRLQGEAIPIAGRIVAIVDVFDALTHKRPYKAAWSTVEALDEIERQAGHQFDPQLVAVFCAVMRQTQGARYEPELVR
jgi:putative two-component system response regulator